MRTTHLWRLELLVVVDDEAAFARDALLAVLGVGGDREFESACC